jgi:hypothetical protein
MIKQPTQPLKFFSSFLEVERDWNNRRHGNPGTHVITEDILFIPPFQIKFEDRDEDITDFTIELIDYITGDVDDITNELRARGVFTYSDFQNLIVYRFPLGLVKQESDYYLRISDGAIGGTDVNEIWYSEVFKLCDLNRNLLRTMASPGDFSGWNSHSLQDVLDTQDTNRIEVCESTGNGAYFLDGEFYVIENEPLDFYALGLIVEIDLGCTETDFLPLYFALVDSGGNIISNTVTMTQGAHKEKLTPTATRYARLKGWCEADEVGHGNWKLYLIHANPQLNDGLGTIHEYDDENIGLRKVLRWSHTCNICDMIYDEQSGSVIADYDEYIYWEMSYENYLILDNPPMIPEFEIKENVSENDKGDKLFLMGAQQDWHYLQLATSENLAKAVYNIHLHDTVEINYDGEAHTLCEYLSEVSYGDDYNFTVKFRFREDNCAVSACCFDICPCPNVQNVGNFYVGIGTLPPCNSGTNGDRHLVLEGGHRYIYQCNGTSWVRSTEEEVEGNCVYSEDYEEGTKYWWWDGTDWIKIAELDTVADGGGGEVDVSLFDGGMPGIQVQLQVASDCDNYEDCGEPYIVTGADDDFSVECVYHAGYCYRLRIYDGSCNYGYSDFYEPEE